MQNKTSVFLETTYGTAQIAADGREYFTENDGGWSPSVLALNAEAQASGAEAPIRRSRSNVYEKHEGSHSTHLYSHGHELLFRLAFPRLVAPASVSGTTPQVYDKAYSSNANGLIEGSGSASVVQESLKFKAGAAAVLDRRVLTGTKVKGYTFDFPEKDLVMFSVDLVAQSLTRSEVTSPITSAAAAATTGLPRPFGFHHTAHRFGAAGAVGGTDIGYIRSLTVSVDNHLDVDRNYQDGNGNIAEPYSMETLTGTVSITADVSDTIQTGVVDMFENDNDISLQTTMTRTPYNTILYIPFIHLTNVTYASSRSGATVMTAEGEIVFQLGSTSHAVELNYRSEGNSNP